jgi:hypothetical protein
MVSPSDASSGPKDDVAAQARETLQWSGAWPATLHVLALVQYGNRAKH